MNVLKEMIYRLRGEYTTEKLISIVASYKADRRFRLQNR